MDENIRRKPPVIADVAKRAGVSVPTVSRVLSGTTRVSPERHARVLKAIEELGYRPNGAAQALARGDQAMIAVFTSSITWYGYASTIHGIEKAAREAGYLITIAVVEATSPAQVAAAINQVLGQPLAGAVVLEYDPAGVAVLAALPEWLPTVAAAAGGVKATDRSHAYMDDEVAAAQATRYLLDLGHKTVHHIAIPSAGSESARTLGWRRALRDRGISTPEIVVSDWAPMAGYDAARRLLQSNDATAILCGNDDIAIAAAKAARDCGLSVPDDLSLIGFDDQPLSAMWDPPLTTIRQDFANLGREAFKLLISDRAGEPQNIRIVPDLVVRGSTAPPPASL
ncbi:LacI family DNA-binding transcriptional regulator [Populibacterium corticicola]|uniref:LacI family DNA-binding transcriptional regulator n=1 Tax=Populibacterium corticicola TaxID=1812826 RepID=A0ABW5XJI1_9MICO